MRAARSFTTVPEMTNPASGIEGTSSAPIVGRVGWTFLTNHAPVTADQGDRDCQEALVDIMCLIGA